MKAQALEFYFSPFLKAYLCDYFPHANLKYIDIKFLLINTINLYAPHKAVWIESVSYQKYTFLNVGLLNEIKEQFFIVFSTVCISLLLA